MRLKLGVFGFLPITHAKTQAKQMHPRSSHAVQHFTRVYLHARTTVDAGDTGTWRTTFILITGKTQRPPIWAPCWNKDGAGSGIWDVVYLWYHRRKSRYLAFPEISGTNMRIFLVNNLGILIKKNIQNSHFCIKNNK